VQSDAHGCARVAVAQDGREATLTQAMQVIWRPLLLGEAAQTKAENFRAIIPQPPLALMSRETPGNVMASSVVDVSMYAIAITLGVIQ